MEEALSLQDSIGALHTSESSVAAGSNLFGGIAPLKCPKHLVGGMYEGCFHHSSTSIPIRPWLKSRMASRIWVWVFITKGPYWATGSFKGFPAMSTNVL